MTTDPNLDPTPESARPARTAAGDWKLEFTGQGGELFGILFLNLILNFVTLGIWFAWGRVRELRYLVGQARVGGDPMSFHGRGGELFRGVLIAFFGFLLPIYVLFLLAGRGESGENLWLIVVGYLLLFVLVGFASVGSLRYRLPRTEWRGIRFGFDGRTGGFLKGYLPRAIMVVVTFGLGYPLYALWRRRWMMEHSRLGTGRFEFNGEPDGLYLRFLICWVLALPTLGLSLVHYTGFQQAYFWNSTSFAGANFATTMTGTNWLGLQLTNMLLAMVTLGIATPWVVVRTHRYFFDHLALEAGPDLASIQQQLQRTGGVGEGVLDALDINSGLDLG